MRLLVVLLLLLTILGSGCTRSATNPYVPDVASGTGTFRIIVQDNHNQRVANATVLVKPAGAYGQTDVQGIFMAQDLPRGNETVVVNAPGYSDGRATHAVVLGEIYEVVVFVDRLR